MERFRKKRFLSLCVAASALGIVWVTPIGVIAATAYQELDLFSNVLSLIRKNYVEGIDDSKLIRDAIRGMVSSLDPHSSYLDAEEFREMQIDTRGEFAGLGIEVVKGESGFVEVVAAIEGTPASRAGIQAKDQIAAICPTLRPKDWEEDCRSTKTMSLDDAVRHMRGRKGTKLTLQILRSNWQTPHSYVIERDLVKVVSVAGRLLEPGYAYLRIRQFQERTESDLRDTLAVLHDESRKVMQTNAQRVSPDVSTSGGSASAAASQSSATDELRGLVLDLRDNPGGLLEQAVAVADLWLDRGVIVQTRGRLENQAQIFSARPERTEPNYPLVVLVNEGSASASEIVAGALQDQHRALVLGTPTFGKGSVQTIYPLSDGSGLRLTTALYYTPSDRSIQEIGITPDILVTTQDVGSDSDASAQAAAASGVAVETKPREKDLEGHFTNEKANGAQSIPEDVVQAGGDDVQLKRALEVLKSWRYFERLKAQAASTSVQ